MLQMYEILHLDYCINESTWTLLFLTSHKNFDQKTYFKKYNCTYAHCYSLVCLKPT